ncbi:fused MFS/spermidine synthase [Schlesneria paludicola]|uniref:fused MFS/spermidine synthase n=1 Tax=Schlesneria paludicola TaxID=360056 RepID=UPI00029A0BD8|nr:fused MFS/spermidine synthase [Schlesneria paludicola]
MTQRHAERGLAIAYAVTIFLSAFLLFQVQPLIGKYILPWFGGGPAVWTTCMLVFQMLLFAGYAYAHLTSRYLSPRHQGYLHITLLVTALVCLPITPDPSWKPTNSDWPAFKIMLLTVSSVGLPYFILSSTGPLLQGWFSRTHTGQSPYRLYSLSNLGSLLALLSYPFVVERTFSTATQSILWSVLFAGFAILCSGSAVGMWQRATAESPEPVAANKFVEAPRPSWSMLGIWFGLAMVPSVMLLATTNQVCLDVAVIPFLWVLPLALYLISFILCFDSDRWYVRKPYVTASAVLLFGSILLGNLGSKTPLMLQVAIYFSAMFCVCMVCHGELVALKPAPTSLTTFFLTISAGGAAGGIFVGLIAPLIFVSYYELHFGMIGFILFYLCLRMREDRMTLPLPTWLQSALVPLALLASVGILSQSGRHAEGSVAVARNFYGVLKVEHLPNSERTLERVRLAHGRIEHGSQFTAAEKRRIPTAYYAESTGVGQLMRGLRPGEPKHVGIVGLGVGTLAAYGQPGDRLRLYEINPDVITMAREHFTYVRDCPAEVRMVTGDARLALEFEPPQQFDVLVLDAFSGDAIPAHLLTKEAIAVYLRHLKPDGVLACHISNLHFDLRPLVIGLAHEFELVTRIRANDPNAEMGSFRAVWALMSRRADVLNASVGTGSEEPLGRKPIVWTDDRSNLFEVLQ